MGHRSQILRVPLMCILFSFACCFWIAFSPLLCFSYGIDYISLICLKIFISLPAHTFITLTDMNHITDIYTSFWFSCLRPPLAGLYYTIVFTNGFVIWYHDKEDKHKMWWNNTHWWYQCSLTQMVKAEFLSITEIFAYIKMAQWYHF